MTLVRERWTTVSAALLAGLVGGLLGSSLHTPTWAAGVNVYRAERFELVRPDGRVAAVLGFKDTGASYGARPFLALYPLQPGGRTETVLLESTFEGGNVHVRNVAAGRSQIVLGNAVHANLPEHPVISDSWIEIDGRSGSSVWSAP